MLYHIPPLSTLPNTKRKLAVGHDQKRAKKRKRDDSNEPQVGPASEVDQTPQDPSPAERLKCPYYQRNPRLYQKKSCKHVTYDTMRGVKWHIERVHTKAPECGCCHGDETCESTLSKLRSINLNRAPFARADPVNKWMLLFKELFGLGVIVPSPYAEEGLSRHEQDVFFSNFTDALMRSLGPAFGIGFDCLARTVADCRRDAESVLQQSQQRSGQHSVTSLQQEDAQRNSAQNIQVPHSVQGQHTETFLDVATISQLNTESGTERYARMAEERLRVLHGPTNAQSSEEYRVPGDRSSYVDTEDPYEHQLFGYHDATWRPEEPEQPLATEHEEPAQAVLIDAGIAPIESVDDLIFQFLTQDAFDSPSSGLRPIDPPSVAAMGEQHSVQGLQPPNTRVPQEEKYDGPVARLLGLRQ